MFQVRDESGSPKQGGVEDEGACFRFGNVMNRARQTGEGGRGGVPKICDESGSPKSLFKICDQPEPPNEGAFVTYGINLDRQMRGCLKLVINRDRPMRGAGSPNEWASLRYVTCDESGSPKEGACYVEDMS